MSKTAFVSFIIAVLAACALVAAYAVLVTSTYTERLTLRPTYEPIVAFIAVIAVLALFVCMVSQQHYSDSQQCNTRNKK